MNFETTEDRIVSALGWISLEHDVSIIYACESGSRAWGFASEDSDYDVRFVYAHHRDWYTSVDSCSKRDVIDGVDTGSNGMKRDLDIAGWDLRKALGLFRKGNPPFLEWINSPIKYVDRYNFRQDVDKLAETHLNKATVVMHYVHMAFGNWRKYLKGDAAVVPMKKYLYVVRPLCAAIYLTELEMGLSYPLPLMPPVNFEHLLSAVERRLPPGLAGAIAVLIEAKRGGAELSSGPRIPELDEWISVLEAEWEGASPGRARLSVPIEELNELFKRLLEVTI